MQNVALFGMAFYFNSTPAPLAASAAVAYLAPLYLVSQGLLGLQIVQLAAVRGAGRVGIASANVTSPMSSTELRQL